MVDDMTWKIFYYNTASYWKQLTPDIPFESGEQLLGRMMMNMNTGESKVRFPFVAYVNKGLLLTKAVRRMMHGKGRERKAGLSHLAQSVDSMN